MSAVPLAFCSEIAGLERSRPPSLLAQARAGNREAFAEMVAPHVPTVYQRALRLTGNTADAEDVSQEALLKAWSRLEQFSGRQDETADDFRAWVSRIAANTAIDVLRQRREGKMLSLEEPRGPAAETLGSGIPAREENPEDRYARREMGRLLADTVVQLPGDLRQVCLLRDVLHYSTQDVAERLGISQMAVRLRLFRAHRRLREKLQHALRPSAPCQERSANGAQARRRAPERSRQQLVPLSAAAGYVCGD
jgi:RNA polymerase sigma-70 factor (ECF subfamily)